MIPKEDLGFLGQVIHSLHPFWEVKLDDDDDLREALHRYLQRGLRTDREEKKIPWNSPALSNVIPYCIVAI